MCKSMRLGGNFMKRMLFLTIFLGASFLLQAVDLSHQTRQPYYNIRYENKHGFILETTDRGTTWVTKSKAEDRQEAATLEISVAPNPINELVEISANTDYSKLSISIIDVLGHEVNLIDISNFQKNIIINLSDFSRGKYILKFMIDGVPSFKSIIKN